MRATELTWQSHLTATDGPTIRTGIAVRRVDWCNQSLYWWIKGHTFFVRSLTVREFHVRVGPRTLVLVAVRQLFSHLYKRSSNSAVQFTQWAKDLSMMTKKNQYIWGVFLACQSVAQQKTDTGPTHKTRRCRIAGENYSLFGCGYACQWNGPDMNICCSILV